ncbi:hypothetical protein OUZ56_008586 [Daphnia magna]|uniref:Uncharacterized protein n=1 Tax=Daphnia magna TaxID=35525 RepID=A0ABR0ADF2_9CRUS|nr:hypothetical protein OUZ56_008586 [Daphnia magna]
MKKSVAAVVVLGFLLVVAFIDASNPQLETVARGKQQVDKLFDNNSKIVDRVHLVVLAVKATVQSRRGRIGSTKRVETMNDQYLSMRISLKLNGDLRFVVEGRWNMKSRDNLTLMKEDKRPHRKNEGMSAWRWLKLFVTERHRFFWLPLLAFFFFFSGLHNNSDMHEQEEEKRNPTKRR